MTAEPVSEIQGQSTRERTIPPPEPVRTGIWSIPVPIPANPLRYTLCYAVDFGDGLVLVDPGWGSDEGWDALARGLGAAGRTVDEVAGVLLTHVHPDHHGLTRRITAVSGAWVAMHPAEFAFQDSRKTETSAVDEAWLSRCGVPDGQVAELALTSAQHVLLLSMPAPDLLLEDGDVVPGTAGRFRAVWTPGHTPGHLCFYGAEEDVLLTGDHLLPRISPNIGHGPFTTDPPLAAYLDSLDRVARYHSALALPGHEYRFAGIADRAAVLRTHHAQRRTELVGLVRASGQASTWDVASRAGWSKGWASLAPGGRRAALAETSAHLHHLAQTRELELVTSGGSDLWTAATRSI